MSIISNSPLVVLQGEVAVVDSRTPLLKTPVPTACHIVTLFDKEHKISVMTHIDDYTSVRSVFNTIERLLQSSFKTSLNSKKFQASVLGGNQDSFSLEQKKAITETLKKLEIPVHPTNFNPQEQSEVCMNPDNGAISFCMGKEINRTLEFLQCREYGDFNDFLDVYYGADSGSDLPYFEAKIAFRKEPSHPELQYPKVSEQFDIREKDTDWKKIGKTLENQEQLHLELSPTRAAIPQFESSLNKVKEYIAKNHPNDATLQKTLKEKNFNLMLRQTATEGNCIALFKLLLNHSSALDIDLTSRGKTSGSVWDVAEKHKNSKAQESLSDLKTPIPNLFK